MSIVHAIIPAMVIIILKNNANVLIFTAPIEFLFFL
jgi:hypothetical protein